MCTKNEFFWLLKRLWLRGCVSPILLERRITEGDRILWTSTRVTRRHIRLPWLVNLGSLKYRVDNKLSVRFLPLHSVVACSISNGGYHGIHCWLHPMRMKQQPNGSVCHVHCLPDFLVMVIQIYNLIPLFKKRCMKFHIVPTRPN